MQHRAVYIQSYSLAFITITIVHTSLKIHESWNFLGTTNDGGPMLLNFSNKRELVQSWFNNNDMAVGTTKVWSFLCIFYYRYFTNTHFQIHIPLPPKIDPSLLGDGNKLFVDNAQQCFAFTPQANFPTHNLDFHRRWRLWDWIQASF